MRRKYLDFFSGKGLLPEEALRLRESRTRLPRRCSQASCWSDDDASPDDALTGLATWLAGAIDALPPRYGDALRQTEIEGRTMREAAGALGVSVSAVKSRVQRGRALLWARLLRCCAVEVDARRRPVGFEGRSRPCGC